MYIRYFRTIPFGLSLSGLNHASVNNISNCRVNIVHSITARLDIEEILEN